MDFDAGEPPRASGGPLVGALKTDHLGELTRLGLRPSDFRCFVDHFVGHRHDYIVKRSADAAWQTVRKRYLTDGNLIGHLAGERWLGTGCRWDPSAGKAGRHVTPYVVVDLDFAGDMTRLAERAATAGTRTSPEWADLLERYDRVTRTLGAPSLVFRSSDSGGLHLYYLLTHAIELHALRAPSGQDGAVLRLLAAEGVPEVPGRAEIYPRGQYKRRGLQNRLRLPFGHGSLALDPDTFDRISTGSPQDDLRAIADRLERGSVPVVDPDFWISEAAALPITRTKNTARSRTAPAPANPGSRREAWSVAAATLWTEGLTGAGQLNSALWILCLDLRRRGAAADEARTRLSEWLDRRHNGCSRTYNASAAIAHQEVADLVARQYASNHVGGDWPALPGLSEWEATSVLTATRDDHQLADPATGEVVKRYKVQLLGFELHRRNKQWLLRELAWRIADVTAGQSEREMSQQHLRTTLAPMVESFWPDLGRPEFIVPVPYRLRLAINGVGKDASWALWRVLQASGLYRLHRGASADAHRAATYLVSLDFGAHSSRPIELDSLPSAVRLLSTVDEVRRLYTRHHAKAIRNACGPRITGFESTDPVLTVVRSCLCAHPTATDVAA